MDIGRDARKLGSFEIDALIAKIRMLTPEDWLADATRQKIFQAHDSTETIKLIADSDFRHEKPTTRKLYDHFAPELSPLMDHIRSQFSQSIRQQKLINEHGPGYFIRTILTRLPAGAEIRAHRDEGYSLKRSHRIHMPIVSNPDVQFQVGDLMFHMPVGEMWEINNRRVHAVKNGGSEARIHLIMDYVQPGETIFDAEGVLTA